MLFSENKCKCHVFDYLSFLLKLLLTQCYHVLYSTEIGDEHISASFDTFRVIFFDDKIISSSQMC